MNGLYFYCERAWGSWKDGKKVNLLCVVDQDHQRWGIEADYSSKFKAIYWTVNPQPVDYSSGNGATIQELPKKLPLSGKGKRKLLLKTEKKESKKWKIFKKF